MMDIILTLVFSIVMLLFMVFPAMQIVAWIEKRIEVAPRWHNPLLLGLTVLLSLAIGIFLRYW